MISDLLKHPVILVSIGGALGANARFGLTVALRSSSKTFPLGTFLANISGSLLLAVLAVLLLEKATPEKRAWFLLLGTGFCGAFTTFSTFELETWILIREDRWGWALLNVFGSVLGGFLAVVLVAKHWPR